MIWIKIMELLQASPIVFDDHLVVILQVPFSWQIPYFEYV